MSVPSPSVVTYDDWCVHYSDQVHSLLSWLLKTCLSWIQLYPYGAIIRHLLNTVNSFLCSSNDYFENRLLPNDLIIIRNHGDDEEHEWDIKRALERQGDAHIMVEIQSNSEFQSLTSSPT
jgi:hypothetical protein